MRLKQTQYDETSIPSKLRELEEEEEEIRSGEGSLQLTKKSLEELKKNEHISLTKRELSRTSLKSLRGSNRNLKLIAKKLNVSSKLTKLRFLTKFHLQLCAVLSQLSKQNCLISRHKEALFHGKVAVTYCEKLIANTLLLCRGYIQQEKVKRANESVFQKQQQLHLESQNSVVPFDSQKSVSALTRVHTFNLKSSSPLHKKSAQPEATKNTAGSKLKIESSIGLPKKKEEEKEEAENKVADTRGPMSYYVEEQTPLLEQLIQNCEPILQELTQMVHNFKNATKLKNPTRSQQFEKAVSEGKAAGKLEEYDIGADIAALQELVKRASSATETTNPSVKKLQTRLRSLSTMNDDGKSRNEYESQQEQRKAVTELRSQKAPKGVSELVRKRLKNEDIGRIKSRESLRVNVRNILGVIRQDDWVFSLNIGNVMHLIPLCFDQFNYHLDNSHELSRDAMLQKVILLSVGYFCVGTQLRFLSAKIGSGISRSDRQASSLISSENWHAQSLEISCTFLPTSCPLVGHVISSYQKHHSPVSQPIPEDQEIEENLKVVHPLNDLNPPGSGRTDPINYHQIVRASSVPSIRCKTEEQNLQPKPAPPKDLSRPQSISLLQNKSQKIPQPPLSPQPTEFSKTSKFRAQQLKSMLSIYSPGLMSSSSTSSPKKRVLQDRRKMSNSVRNSEISSSGLDSASSHKNLPKIKSNLGFSQFKSLSPGSRKSRKQLTTIWKSPPPAPPNLKNSKQSPVYTYLSKKTQRASEIYSGQLVSPALKRTLNNLKEKGVGSGFAFHRPPIAQSKTLRLKKGSKKIIGSNIGMHLMGSFLPSSMVTLDNISPRTTRIETEPAVKNRDGSPEEELEARRSCREERTLNLKSVKREDQSDQSSAKRFHKSLSLQSLYEPLPTPLPNKTPTPEGETEEKKEERGMVTSLDIRPTYLTRLQSRRKVGLAPKMPKQAQILPKRVLNRRTLFDSEKPLPNFSPRLQATRFKK